MDSFKISDKTKIIIIIVIAIFEITFVQLTKDKPRIVELSQTQVNSVGTVVQGELDVTDRKTSDTLEVHYLDVGQGDAIYIGYGDFDMVIDAGNNDDGDLVVDYLAGRVTEPIELIVASHAHEDHIGGLDDVIHAHSVKTVIDSGEVKDTKTYRDYMAAALESGATVLNDENQTYYIDEHVTVEIMEAVDDASNTNNNSVLVKLTYDEVSFLFTGDMEEEVESSILLKPIKATVFKAAHHGSDTSNSDMFLRRVQPEMIIISAGRDNKYGHPHKDAVQRMLNQTHAIYGTWENGTIIVRTDGHQVQSNASKSVTMDDAHESAIKE